MEVGGGAHGKEFFSESSDIHCKRSRVEEGLLRREKTVVGFSVTDNIVDGDSCVRCLVN